MKYKKSFIFICFVICLFSIASISASDVNDNAIASEGQDLIEIENQDSLDVNVATEEVDNENQKFESDVISSSNEEILNAKDNGSFTALQNKINNAGNASTITLENDYTYTVGDDDALKKGVAINGDQLIGDKTFTINGNGHIINGNKTARMFTVINDAHLILKNLTLTQGQGSDENILGMMDNIGGAIYGDNAKLTLINCTLTYNNADIWGGAIYASDCSVHILDSQITWNNAPCGAIYTDDCYVDITDSQITNNTAEYGGAIYAIDCSVYITDSQLTNNTAEYGGAIHIIDCCVDINGSDIMLNTATEGGAIEAYGGLDYGYWVKITSSDITQNGATTGGAIYATSFCKVSITGSKFVKNTATADGGAIYACNEQYGSTINKHPAFCNLNISDSTFIENSATTGGAIYACNRSCNVDLTKNNFTSNGIYISNHSNVDIHNCILNNSLVEGGDVDLSDCEVIKAIVIDAVDLNKYYGGPENVTVILTEDNMALSNVYVQISVNGKNYTAKTDSNGRASILLNLPVGSYDVVSSYDGLSTNSKVTVKSTLKTSDINGTYLNSEGSATFLDTAGNVLASKHVTFKVGDKTYAATTNSNGVATADIPLGVGTYNVTAVNPVNNEQKTFKLTISKAVSKIALALTQSNDITTLTATLTPVNATGNVVFNVNGENKNIAIINGKAILKLNDLEKGNYTVTAGYNGDNNLEASNSTITFTVAEKIVIENNTGINTTQETPADNNTSNTNASDTTGDKTTDTNATGTTGDKTTDTNSTKPTVMADPVISADNVNAVYSAGTYYTIKVTGTDGKPANTVVKITGKISKTLTATNGIAKFKIDQVPGTYKITITSLGKSVTKTITVKHLVTLKTVKVKKSAKKLVLQATLGKVNGKCLKNKKITFKFNGKKYTAKTNKKGVAKLTIPKKVLKKLKVGKKVTYQATYLKDTVKKTVKVKK